MNKKLIIGIAVILVIIVVGSIGYFLLTGSKNNNGETNSGNKVTSSNGKTLVVYFSATNNTKKVAEEISKNLDADLFELVPREEYTSEDLDWTNDNSRVSKEHKDASLRNIEPKNTSVDNWESYDTILIGYPIWWGIAAWPVDTFVKANDFTGKTVIPFCTSASSGLGSSGNLLEEEAGTGSWIEGRRFNSNASSADIKAWTDSLK